jgi:hypothetical protein
MPDRTEIACVIAEWWHNQKEKKNLLESTITLEQFLQIDKLEPLEIVEEKVQLVLKKPGGKRKVIWKQGRNGSKVLKEKSYSFIDGNFQIKKEESRLGCDTCRYEIYYPSEEEDGQAWNRGCLCDEAQDYFNRKCALKFSRCEIPPVTNCRCWTKVKVKSVV